MINLSIPDTNSQLHPRITVVGVGGAGGNAVNNMITANLEGVDFLVANTDAQALNHSHADRRLQLGTSLTQGLGAGSRPEIGQAAAEEAIDDIIGYLEGSHMVFITGGMGGGTGTGAGPVMARAARELGILTVGVVTKPFHFEGAHRMKTAEAGILEMQKYVDTLIVIPNQNLFRLANEKTTFAEAFQMADEVLHSGVRGVTDLMVMPGLINLDFADIRTVMSEMGKAMMGTGEAEGEKRAIEAAEAAISNPLLDDVSMKGARGVLVNITGGSDMTLYEVDEAVNRIREEVDGDANLIFGSTFLDSLEGKMRVSVVSTGIDQEARAIDPNTGRPQLAVVGGRQIAPGQPAEHAATAQHAAVDQEEMVLDNPVEPEPARPAAPVRGLDPRMAGVGVEPQRPAAPAEAERRGSAFLPPKPIQPPSRPQALGHGRHAQAEAARKGGAGRLFKAMTGLLGGEEGDHPAAPATGEIASRAEALHRQHSQAPVGYPSAPAQQRPTQPMQDPMARHADAQTGQADRAAENDPGATGGQADVWSSPESLAGHPPRATGTDPAPQPVSAARPAPQPVAAPARRANQAPLPRHEDDQLEIPAFLRRQAN